MKVLNIYVVFWRLFFFVLFVIEGICAMIITRNESLVFISSFLFKKKKREDDGIINCSIVSQIEIRNKTENFRLIFHQFLFARFNSRQF